MSQYGVTDFILLGHMVMRSNDPLTHLGPPFGLIPTWAAAFSTRCGLQDSNFYYTEDLTNKYFCIECLKQGCVPHEVKDWTYVVEGTS